MQTRSQKPELLEEPEIERLPHRLRKEQREKIMVEAKDATRTLMEYLTHHLRETNNIQLSALPRGVTLEFKHGFLQMIETTCSTKLHMRTP